MSSSGSRPVLRRHEGETPPRHSRRKWRASALAIGCSALPWHSRKKQCRPERFSSTPYERGPGVEVSGCDTTSHEFICIVRNEQAEGPFPISSARFYRTYAVFEKAGGLVFDASITAPLLRDCGWVLDIRRMP